MSNGMTSRRFPYIRPVFSQLTQNAINGVAVSGRVSPLLLLLLPHAAPEHPGDAGDAGGALLVAQPLLDQPLSDLPAEDARVVFLVLLDLVLHLRRGHPWLAASDNTRSDTSRLLIPQHQTVSLCLPSPLSSPPTCSVSWTHTRD